MNVNFIQDVDTDIEPKLWGPSVWNSMHWVAAGYPENPSEGDRENYIEFFRSLLKVLPSRQCRFSSADFFDEKDLERSLGNNLSLRVFVMNFHNRVNSNINFKYKKKTLKDIYKLYPPAYITRCSPSPSFNFKFNSLTKFKINPFGRRNHNKQKDDIKTSKLSYNNNNNDKDSFSSSSLLSSREVSKSSSSNSISISTQCQSETGITLSFDDFIKFVSINCKDIKSQFKGTFIKCMNEPYQHIIVEVHNNNNNNDSITKTSGLYKGIPVRIIIIDDERISNISNIRNISNISNDQKTHSSRYSTTSRTSDRPPETA